MPRYPGPPIFHHSLSLAFLAFLALNHLPVDSSEHYEEDFRWQGSKHLVRRRS